MALFILSFVIALAIVAFILHPLRQDNTEHKLINDERIAQGLPPLSRKDLGID